MLAKKISFVLSILIVQNLFAQKLIPHQFKEYGGKYGYIDEKTKETKVFWHFDKAYPFYLGIALAEYKGAIGVIDSLGNIVIPFCFNSVKILTEKNFLISDRSNFNLYKAEILSNGNLKIMDSTWENNKIRIYNLNDSKIKSILFINTDIEKEAIKIYERNFILNSIDEKSNLFDHNKKKIWNTFQLGVIDNANRQGFYELKGGLYLQNKNFLTGISYGFNRTKVFTNNATYFNYQIPIYISQILFFRQPQKGTTPYLKMDLGYILSESSFYIQSNAKKPYDSNFDNTNLILNASVGLKLSRINKNTGIFIESGYKFLPQRMQQITTVNYFNLLFGVIF